MYIAKKQVEQRKLNLPDTACSKNLTTKNESNTDGAEAMSTITQLIEPVEQMEISDVSDQKSKLQKYKRKRSPTPRTQKEKMPLMALRFNGLRHDIAYDDPNGARKGHRCKYETCSQPTTVFCETCKVHLCFVTGKKGRNCFKRFHTLNES